jgi:hypothetical protein
MTRIPNPYLRLTSSIMFFVGLFFLVISYASGHKFNTYEHPAMFSMRIGFIFNSLVFVSSIIYANRLNKLTQGILIVASILNLLVIGLSLYKFWIADQFGMFEVGLSSLYILGTIIIMFIAKTRLTKEIQ